MKPLQEVLAENIKHLRLSHGYSQEKLAELADIHRTYLSAIEGGKRNVSIQCLQKIAAGLDVPSDELLRDFEAEKAFYCEWIGLLEELRHILMHKPLPDDDPEP